ncbi:hypothetical protein D3C78_1614670 [compost metagenome]
MQELRIDEHARLVAVLGDIDHDQALVEIHLRRREADTLGLVHGLEHVVDLLLQRAVEAGYRPGNLVQTRVGVMQNVEQCHNQTVIPVVGCRDRQR